MKDDLEYLAKAQNYTMKRKTQRLRQTSNLKNSLFHLAFFGHKGRQIHTKKIQHSKIYFSATIFERTIG